MDYVLIAGIAVFCFILLYFSNALAKEHTLLKILAYFFVIASVVLLGKALIDGGESCEQVLDYELQNVTSINVTQTNYFYTTSCYDNNTNGTAQYTYNLFLGFVVIFFIYVFVYFSYNVLSWAGKRFSKK